jgi:hypothetical protein
MWLVVWNTIRNVVSIRFGDVGWTKAIERQGDDKRREDERCSIWINSICVIATRSLNDVVYVIAILS